MVTLRIPIPYLSLKTKILEVSVSQEWFLLFVFCFLTAISISVSTGVSVSISESGISVSVSSISISTISSISTSIVSVVGISLGLSLSRPLGNSMGGNWGGIGSISSIWSIVVGSMMGIWVSNMVGIGGIRIGSMGIGNWGSNGLHLSNSRLFSSNSFDNSVSNWETSIAKMAKTSIAKTMGQTITSIGIRITIASIKESWVSLSFSLGLRGGISSSKQTNLNGNILTSC